MDALSKEKTVRVPDMASGTRRSRLAQRTAEAGAGTMRSIQLWVQSDDLGALDLYGRGRNAFTDESEPIGLLFVSRRSGHGRCAGAGPPDL